MYATFREYINSNKGKKVENDGSEVYTIYMCWRRYPQETQVKDRKDRKEGVIGKTDNLIFKIDKCL